jgi:hypothetical protein
MNENFSKFAIAPALSLIRQFLSKINTIKELTRALQNALYLIVKYYSTTKYTLIKWIFWRRYIGVVSVI